MTRLNAEFLEGEALRTLGFRALGVNVRVHQTAVLVDCAKISIGDHVRIDPFVLISVADGIEIGSYVHIAAHASIIGAAAVQLEDFTGISQGARILTSSDDFTGDSLMGPTIPAEYRTVISAPVRLGACAVLGAGAIVLPGASIGEGALVGALSLVNKPLDPWAVYVGAPARRIRERPRDALQFAAKIRQNQSPGGAGD